MKAIVYHSYGSPDVLRYEDIDKPTAGDDQVLIKVRAASVNPPDWHFMKGTPYLLRLHAGLRKPKDIRLGIDLAGQVEAVGKSVTQFKPGDEVFGDLPRSVRRVCGCRESSIGPQADERDIRAGGVRAGGGIHRTCRGFAIREMQPGQKVLINGASGGVGTFAVQIAKSFGANVTGVCSTKNVEMVRSIGADRVIDYTQDFTRSGQRYDLLLDCVGNHSLSACRRVLSPKGILSWSAQGRGRWIGPLARLLQALVLITIREPEHVAFIAKLNKRT